jgi:hypothetical protein
LKTLIEFLGSEFNVKIGKFQDVYFPPGPPLPPALPPAVKNLKF